MVNLKQIGLGLFAILCVTVLLTAAEAAAEITLTPASGELGSSILVTGTNFTNSSTVNITFNSNVDLVTSVTVSNDGFTKTVTLPSSGPYAAGPYAIAATSDNESDSENFNVTNSAPKITGSIDDAYVGAEYIEKVEVSDPNENPMTCSLTEKDGLTSLQVASSPILESEKLYCKLYFSSSGGKPTTDDVGDYDITLKIDDGTTSTTQDFDLKVLDYVEVTKVELDDTTGDDDDHMPGDTIEVEVTVRNRIDKSALGLDDEILEDIKITIENNDLDLDEDSTKFDLDDNGDKLTKTLSFQIPYDADEGTYVIDITARGDDDDGNEHKTVTTKSITVERNAHDLIVTDVEFQEGNATCGDDVTLKFTVKNIGKTDEEDILITITADKLNLKKDLDEFDIDENKKSTKEVEFKIPKNAYDDTYQFKIKITYDDGDEIVTKHTDLIIEDCKSNFLDLDLTSNTVNIGDTTNFTITLENIGLASEDFEIKLVDIDKFGTYNTSAELDDIEIEGESSKSIDIELITDANTTEGLYEIKVEIYKDDELIGSKSVGLTLKKTGLLSGFAASKGDASQASLVIGILLVLALIIYLGYQLWFKGKDWSKLGKEKGDENKDEDDASSLIFEDEDPMKPARKGR